VRVAYVVSRFPVATETFIVRELNEVDADPEIAVDLFALFPPVQAFTHPAAERWVPLAHQPTVGASLAGLLFWAARRPARLATSVAAVVRGYWRRPARLARALATVPIAAGHARTMRRIGAEHVHAHFANYPALAAWLAGRLLDVPYSVTAHAHDLFVDQSNLRRLVDDAAFFATISEYNRAFISRLGVSGGTPIEVVHCGVDLDRLGFRERDLPREGRVRLLCIAGLQEKKGHRVLLDALAMGLPGFERFELELVGTGPLEAGLREHVQAVGLSRRVRLLGGQTEDAVLERLLAADALVLPSVVARDGEMEGIPVAIMEALATGLPAVGTSLSGLPELVRGGATLLLATPGDPVSLATALRALLEDPEAAQARARAGRALVETEFDIRETGRRMVALLRSTRRPRGGT
jgi:colanic acid/amylovoran biosynthesis glycosyltransferase